MGEYRNITKVGVRWIYFFCEGGSYIITPASGSETNHLGIATPQLIDKPLSMYIILSCIQMYCSKNYL